MTARSVESVIGALKNPPDPDAIARLPVAADDGAVAFLRPVPFELKGVAADDARLMAEWRNRSPHAFFTWIAATEQGTRRWLDRTYARDARDIIFMLEAPGGAPFGHVALYNFQDGGAACEFGRIVRGAAGGPRGGMTWGCLAALLWASAELGTRRFFLEVFADNSRAIALYERIGFQAGARIPLRRVDEPQGTRWDKTPPSPAGADGYALRMESTTPRLQAARAELALIR